MKMVRILVNLPKSLKAKLDAQRRHGTTASGLIRHLLEQHFKGKKARNPSPSGRQPCYSIQRTARPGKRSARLHFGE